MSDEEQHMATETDEAQAEATAADPADVLAGVRDFATATMLREALTPLPDEGPIHVRSDGTVVLTWRGPRPAKVEHSIALDPPTTGEYRELVAKMEKIEADAEKRQKANGQAAKPRQSDCYKWWAAAVAALSDDTLPPEAETPQWLQSWNLVTRTVTTWLSVPTEAPGS